jgi:predicted metal-binding membrane protein
MSLRLTDGKGIALRAMTAAACIAAVLLALVLSAIPQLHEQIHGAPNHECAVTLLTSGNYQHTPTATISLAPPAPPTAFVHALSSFQLVSARLECSLLEHAPPTVS